MIEVKNLTKKYGDKLAVNNISFKVEKGEILSIIGSSGSGKTTLLRCLNFLETPDKGKILLDGKEIFNAEKESREYEKELRQKRLHFGLVFQQFNLFPQYNIFDNICLAPLLLAKERPDYKVNKKEIKASIEKRALELLERVGLADRKDAYPCELSGGQQQRVAIARALALSPDILCFDEPTSALDPELTGEVLKVIKSLKSSDSTMIVVTHEMEFARNVADKVIFMADGIIEEVGTPDEVFGNPKSPKTKNFLSNAFNN